VKEPGDGEVLQGIALQICDRGIDIEYVRTAISDDHEITSTLKRVDESLPSVRIEASLDPSECHAKGCATVGGDAPVEVKDSVVLHYG
jgi:hypothetical protein